MRASIALFFLLYRALSLSLSFAYRSRRVSIFLSLLLVTVEVGIQGGGGRGIFEEIDQILKVGKGKGFLVIRRSIEAFDVYISINLISSQFLSRFRFHPITPHPPIFFLKILQ